MPKDPHLFKGEGERFRRYGRFLIEPRFQTLSIFEHDSFYQSKKFDDLYGDIHRDFAAMTPSEYENDFLQMLIVESYLSLPLPQSLESEDFEVSIHMLRIEATQENLTGRPAPEGVHQDGYHFGSIHLMNREHLLGAENHIYSLKKELIEKTTLLHSMDSIYFDDQAIFHGVSPFEQEDKTKKGTRDMLILLYQPLSESPQKENNNFKTLRFYSSRQGER